MWMCPPALGSLAHRTTGCLTEQMPGIPNNSWLTLSFVAHTNQPYKVSINRSVYQPTVRQAIHFTVPYICSVYQTTACTIKQRFCQVYKRSAQLTKVYPYIIKYIRPSVNLNKRALFLPQRTPQKSDNTAEYCKSNIIIYLGVFYPQKSEVWHT